MSLGMYESRILSPHRPRPYSLLQVLEVDDHGYITPDGDPQRWIAGANQSLFGSYLHSIDLTACDFEISGWDTEEGTEELRMPFTSVLTGECSHLAGEEVLSMLEANLRSEHDALMSYILDRELILGSTSGLTDQSLSEMATRDDPASSVEGAGLVGYAESLSPTYENVILVPIAWFEQAAETARWDGDVWRTRAGNILVPQVADAEVYVVPTPMRLDLAWSRIQEVRRSRNIRELGSVAYGLFELHTESFVFDPS